MDKFILALDQGTTSTRCIIFNRSGSICSVDQMEHAQIYPRPGWVEHDPMEILAHMDQVINHAISKADLKTDQIAAMGITNQRETTILWDRNTGTPVSNAIVWQDTRTDHLCEELSAGNGIDHFRDISGLPIATYFSGPKILWLIENDPNLRSRAESGDLLFGTMDTWLIWNLTGGRHGGLHITDVTNASRTMLMDLRTLDWSPELLSALNIPPQILPRILPSSHISGKTSGVAAGIPIASILGDQQAALFGQTCFSPGEAKNTYGTGCFMLLNTGNQPIFSQNGLITTVGYQMDTQPAVYCLEGSIAIAGALVQWLRDNLQMIDSSTAVEQLAASVENNGGVYFVPAFSGLFAPYWRSDARGVIIGLTRYVNRGHIARASLEATAFQTREVLDAMYSDAAVRLESLKVDGGMVFNELMMQFQADLLDVPVIRPKIFETTALGTAFSAGLAVGYWKSFDELREIWQSDRTWFPVMPQVERDKLYGKWKKAVTHTFNWMEGE